MEEAIRSALTLDYANYEIIICDDASTDRTFEIEQKIVDEYSGDVHIELKRSEENLGIGGNFYNAFALSKGEWMVMCAGDDISLPDRLKIYEQAIRDNPDSRAFGSCRIIIDGEGRERGFCVWGNYIHGASAFWHRSLFEKFPQIPKGIMAEDALLYLRCFLLGAKVTEIKIPSIKYRIDGLSESNPQCATFGDIKRKNLRLLKNYYNVLLQFKADIESFTPPVREEGLVAFNNAALTRIGGLIAEREEEIHECLDGSLPQLCKFIFRTFSSPHRKTRLKCIAARFCPALFRPNFKLDFPEKLPLQKEKYITYDCREFLNNPIHHCL